MSETIKEKEMRDGWLCNLLKKKKAQWFYVVVLLSFLAHAPPMLNPYAMLFSTSSDLFSFKSVF